MNYRHKGSDVGYDDAESFTKTWKVGQYLQPLLFQRTYLPEIFQNDGVLSLYNFNFGP